MTINQASAKMAELYKQAQSRIPETISLPRLTMYEDFITKNASSVAQIESALRSLTYIIPGRFRESEIASESLHSTIQLLSLYHTSLLSRAFASLPLSIPRTPLSPHNRYTRFWSSRSPLYKRLALLLQTIQYTELLCEMGAKRKGEKVRWRVVVVLEVIKAGIRLLLMRLTGGRPALSPALPEREADPRGEGTDSSQGAWNAMDTLPLEEENASSTNGQPWTMPRTGLPLPNLPSTAEISTYLLQKVLTADDIKSPLQLLHRLSTVQAQLAETMWILRPVVYALAMQRFQGDKRNWTPWVLGVSIEAAARGLAKRDAARTLMTGLEREEAGRRGWGVGWWGMRGAFYQNVTRGAIQSVTDKLRGKLLLDMVGGVIEDYDYLWDGYYFSTTTM